METDEHDRAVELLKELGMKTYEAECFAALNSIPSGTARDISELADVPRTRVYDATDALAEQGFVEVQHTSPQQFRAIPLTDAVQALRDQYEERVERLHETLESLESDPDEREADRHEVWALAGDAALNGRVAEYIGNASSEVVVVLGDDACWTGSLAEAVDDAIDRGVEVRLGSAPSIDVSAMVGSDVEDFDSDLGWMSPRAGVDTRIGRVVLVDREVVILSAVHGPLGADGERAIVAEGPTNAVVVLWRRLLSNQFEEIPAAA